MPSTSRWAIPYPLVSDPPNFPDQLGDLALSVDNMAKDDQGPFHIRPISTPGEPGKFGRYYFATDEGVLYRDFGTGWRPAYIAEMGADIPGAAPTDYMYWHVLMNATNGIVWTFRYVASEATYKWVCVGGPPLVITTPNSSTNSWGSAAAYGAIGGPQIVLPRAGVYEIEYGANMWNSTADCGELMSIQVPIPGPDDPPSDNDAIGEYIHANTDPDGSSLFTHHHARRATQKTFTVPGAVTCMGKTVGGGTANFRGTHLSIRPIQVS